MRTKLLISVDHPAKVSEVARKLRRAGVKVEEEDADFQFIRGSAQSANLKSLRQISGVRDIEEERTISVPDADEAVQ